MRLAIRSVLRIMSGIESTLDEIGMLLREKNSHYYAQFAEVRKLMRNTRRSLAEILDQMIDEGGPNG